MRGKIYIGTSGWHYKHWKGTFYPHDIADHEQFVYYKKIFTTVEINNSFYKLPSPETFREWRKASPGDFIFSVKASRYISHMKKLKLDAKGIRLFFTHVRQLKEKLGPILFQLPPKWKLNLDRLRAFLKILPKNYRYAFEFRDADWYREEVFDVLKEFNCAFCIFELDHHVSPLEITSDFVYVRLHGPGKKYQGNYSTQTLRKWKRRCEEWQKRGKDVYIYFDNDQAGFAAFNAMKLKQMAGGKR